MDGDAATAQSTVVRAGVGGLGPPTDAELVAAALRGEAEAFAELYARHRRAVAAAARDWIDDRDRRLDIVQETFARALQKLDRLVDPERFRPWVLQIGRNAAIDELRKRQKLTEVCLDGVEPPARSADGEPELVAEVTDLAGRIGVGMVSLSKRDATALALAAHLGLGPSEIAAALGVTPNNAKVILHRARARLRAAVGADDDRSRDG